MNIATKILIFYLLGLGLWHRWNGAHAQAASDLAFLAVVLIVFAEADRGRSVKRSDDSADEN